MSGATGKPPADGKDHERLVAAAGRVFYAQETSATPHR
jgi:hypothetical protein